MDAQSDDISVKWLAGMAYRLKNTRTEERSIALSPKHMRKMLVDLGVNDIPENLPSEIMINNTRFLIRDFIDSPFEVRSDLLRNVKGNRIFYSYDGKIV